jgi:hypothetical protein
MWYSLERRKMYKILVGKPEVKRSLGRPRRRCEEGIRMDLGKIGWGVWSGLNWLRIGTGAWLLNAEMNLRVLAPRS